MNRNSLGLRRCADTEHVKSMHKTLEVFAPPHIGPSGGGRGGQAGGKMPGEEITLEDVARRKRLWDSRLGRFWAVEARIFKISLYKCAY